MIEFLWNPIPMLIIGITLGIIFDEWFTTKFAWLKREGREALRDLKDRL